MQYIITITKNFGLGTGEGICHSRESGNPEGFVLMDCPIKSGNDNTVGVLNND